MSSGADVSSKSRHYSFCCPLQENLWDFIGLLPKIFKETLSNCSPLDSYITIMVMSSDAWIPKRSSCPVSRIGSPLLHPKSSQTTLSGTRSTAIFRPQTAPASSTPYTGGIGALPVHHFSHSKAGAESEFSGKGGDIKIFFHF